MYRLLFSFVLAIHTITVVAQMMSPEDFFPGEYGKKFTPHHRLVDYIQHLAANSQRIKLEQFGTTNEGRPMYVCFVSDPENLSQMENIRQTHLYHIGLATSLPIQPVEKVITWLSYSVHGNEAAGSEASMQVLYDLLSKSDEATMNWLKNSLVIINPSLNPDGYNRYTQWHRSHTSVVPNALAIDVEHNEDWPSGRVNHYLFDLNRDWAWQTQKESKQFIKLYNNWMPHIHTDVHEMGYNEHYYFAPAAEPYHKFITPFQRKFQIEVGKNNARYFDKKGWLYFTREVFDLFYPSYGDTYPTYNGAIGMTYEKAGIRAGRSVKISNGDTLTLVQRIEEHRTTSLATIELAAGRSAELITEFRKFFSESRQKPKGKFQTYVMKNHERLNRLATLLDQNGIEYGYAYESKKVIGFHYNSGMQREFEIRDGDMVIQADQPRSVLTQVLFEYDAALADSNTYDITAWSLPFAYNLEAYGTVNKTPVKTRDQRLIPTDESWPDDAYALYFSWKSIEAPQLLAKLYEKGVVVRMNTKPTQIAETNFEPGTIFITRGDNPNIILGNEIKNLVRSVQGSGFVMTGMSDKGGDIGGNSFTVLRHPRILALTGEGTATNEAGQVWHFFDEVIKYSITRCEPDRLSSVDLTLFNTIIFPDGDFDPGDEFMKNLQTWVLKGGNLIVMGGSLTLFTDRDGWALNTYATDEEKENAKKDKELKILNARKDQYHDHDRRELSEYVSGAIVENKLDASHPLAFGLNSPYFSLKTGNQAYKLLKNTWNPIYIPSEYKHMGFIGANVKPILKESVSYAVENLGSGNVIYMIDNPLFRGFWEAGNLLFSNALFLIK